LFLDGEVPVDSRRKVFSFLSQVKPKDRAAYQRRLEETAHTILLMPEFQLA